jgi:F0F1-type ATP synthase membrane subunit c/vacuolar-type H+-ATPase subunit K
MYLRRGPASSDGLTRIRVIFVGFVSALWLIAFVLLFVILPTSWWNTDQSLWFVVVVLVTGCLTSFAVRWVRGRRLDASSSQKLAASFLAQMFIGIGYAELAALVAFVGTFFMGALWIYFPGLVLATVNLVLVGPTRREIARRQEQITAQGSPLSLVQALMETPPPGLRRKRI